MTAQKDDVMRKLWTIIFGAWSIILWLVFILSQAHPFLKQNNLPIFVIAILVGAGFLVIASGVGLKILGKGEIRETRIVIGTSVGLAIIGLMILALASAGLLYGIATGLLLGLLALIARHEIIDIGKFVAKRLPREFHILEVLFLGMLAFALSITLINCLAPLTANDALVYHINLPKTYCRFHHLEKLPFNVYANMPHNGEILYTATYSITGEVGSRVFYFLLIVATAFALYTSARRCGGKTAALVATSILIVEPLLIDNRIVCNVDILLTLFTLAVVLVLMSGKEIAGNRKFFVLGLLLGFMLGIKYSAAGMLIGIIIAVLYDRVNLKHLGIAILVTFLAFMPWMVKNQLYIGNPLYPLLERIFDGKNWDNVQAAQLMNWQRSMGMGRGIGDYLMLPFNVFTRGKPGLNYTRFDGTINPLLLVLLPLVFLKRDRNMTKVLIVALVGFVFWMITSQQLRFLLPVLALLGIAASYALENLRTYFGKKFLAIVLLLIFAVEISGMILPDQYGKPVASGAFCDRLPIVAGLEQKQAYLARTTQEYEMMEYINKNLPPNEPILLIWENRGYYLDRPYFADSFFEASTLMRTVERSGSVENFERWIRSMGFRYFLVNNLLGQVFAPRYKAPAINLLKEFITKRLEPIHRSNRITLYKLKD